MELVPYKVIVMFTLFQLVYFLLCYGMTWVPVAGIFFPALFFLLISIREHLLPKLFDPQHLQVLDAADYEEIVAAPIQHSSFAYRVKLFCFFFFWVFSGRDYVNKCVIPFKLLL